MTDFHLGVNNCFAVKRWPLAGDWAEICAHELELKLVQFSFDLLDPRTSQPARSWMVSETLDAVKDHGLTIHSTFTGLAAYSFNLLSHPNAAMRIDAIDWFTEAIGLTANLKAKATGGHLAAQSYPDYKDERRRLLMEDAVVESLGFLSSRAATMGLEMLLWEPMPLLREPPSTISDAKRLLARVNVGKGVPVRLAIDTGHQCAAGVEGRDLDTYAWLRELAAESPVIHVQQTDGRGDRHWPFTKKYNDVGVIKPEKMIEAIEASGAKEVYLMLEIIHAFEAPEQQVLEELRESAGYWSNFV
ncbi:MAG: TIM barrel protein [Candidatus Bathyarchaeia archaeon]